MTPFTNTSPALSLNTRTSNDQVTPGKDSTHAEPDLGSALRITFLLTWRDSRLWKRLRRGGGSGARVVGDGWEDRSGLLVVVEGNN